jgi:hypothetical protein
VVGFHRVARLGLHLRHGCDGRIELGLKEAVDPGVGAHGAAAHFRSVHQVDAELVGDGSGCCTVSCGAADEELLVPVALEALCSKLALVDGNGLQEVSGGAHERPVVRNAQRRYGRQRLLHSTDAGCYDGGADEGALRGALNGAAQNVDGKGDGVRRAAAVHHLDGLGVEEVDGGP